MSRVRRSLTALTAVASLPLLAALTPASAGAAAPSYTQVTLQIPVSQPDDEGNHISVDAGVDVPTSGCPCPIFMINHGFLGSWHDSDDVMQRAVANGYVVVRYSSRGFGSTPGEVDLLGPKERQDQLDVLHYMETDPRWAGVTLPEAAVYGGSYGGAHAWAAAEAAVNPPEPVSYDAAVAATIKTVVPAATWTDLYQALVPNDVFRMTYTDGFYATGYDPTASLADGLTSGSPQDTTPSTQQNFSLEMHRWMAEANSGVGMADIKAGLDARSVLTNGALAKITVPVFMIQGSNDGLFSENEALVAYQALAARHVPVHLYIGGIGHPPADGSTTSPEALNVLPEVMAWVNHWVKGTDNGILDTPPLQFANTSFFGNHWDGTTLSSYSYPFGPAQTLSLCTESLAGGTLSTTPCPSAQPAVAANVPAGQGYDQEPVSSTYFHEAIQDLTGCTVSSPTCQSTDPSLASAPQVLSYDAPPVAVDTEYAGVPSLHLVVGSADMLPSATDGTRGGLAAFQLDPKLYDVSPSGDAVLVTRGAYAQPLDATAPSQQTIPSHPVSYDAFGMGYRLPAGHHWRLTLQTSDVPFLKPAPDPFVVALFAGSTVELPTAVGTFPTPPYSATGLGTDLPEAPLPWLLAAAGTGCAGAVAVAVRRRTKAG